MSAWFPIDKFEAYLPDYNESFSTKGLHGDSELRNLFPPAKKDPIQVKRFSPKLDIHPSTIAAGREPQIPYHKAYSEAGDGDRMVRIFKSKLPLSYWHNDLTFEEYSSGTIFFVGLELPDAGGDTLFGDAIEAYNRTSCSL